MDFTSDNVWGAWPEIVEALARANMGPATSYGEDEVSARVKARFCEIFERDVETFFVVTGTAANALALATIVPPHGAVVCHASSHIAVDECGAPEFFTHGARLATAEGAFGKLSPGPVKRALGHFQRGIVHHAQPAAISIAEATEAGTVYRPDEIAALAEIGRARGMKMHMDGARLANALAALACSPAEATWRAGIDVLSFGATKGGALAAEAVVFFNKDHAGDFAYRRKKSGHLLSKMRFVAAQLEAYLSRDLWLERAGRANALAAALAGGFRQVKNAELAFPVETNMVFVRLPDRTVSRLRGAGARFYDWEPSDNGRTLVRLVTSFATPEEGIARLLAIAAE